MFRKYDLVVALYVFGVLTAELLGPKTVPLGTIGSFHLNVSVAILVLPLLFTMTDVVVEVLGKKRARGLVYCGLIVAALLIIYTQLAVRLPASVRFAPSEPAYDKIFGMSARIAAASLAAFAGSELLDVLVFAKLRESMGKRALWFRNNVSNFVSQFADSAIFLTLAFYSIRFGVWGNVLFIAGLVIPYWLIRCGLSVVETPLVYLGVNWLKKGDASESNPDTHAKDHGRSAVSRAAA